MVDLHQLLPSDFATSTAAAIEIDTKGTIIVAGSGFNSMTQRTEALLWTTGEVPLAGDINGDGFVDILPKLGDSTGKGIVDVDDLLEVINAWGDCPHPCPPDHTNNSVVDVDDLLVVINNWG